MGVQLFAGKFHKCVYNGTHIRVDMSENVANKDDCLAKNFIWENSRVNFDNVLNGYLALFQVVSVEKIRWRDVNVYFNRQRSKDGLKLWPMQLIQRMYVD